MSGYCNVAAYLPEMAARTPDAVAVSAPVGRRGGKLAYETMTFAQLDAEADRYAHGLRAAGVERGTRVLLMVRPGLEFVALSFALFKTGSVPVLIDPGMGKVNLLNCVEKARPEAMVAVPLAHLARRLYPGRFRSVRTLVTVGRRWLWGGWTAAGLKAVSQEPFEIERTAPDDMAAILFTTGSTGPPKGVVYEHGMFDAQVRLIRDHYGIREGDVDFPAFPLFALFSIAMGMSVVVPAMDPTKPAQADPAVLVGQINDKKVTITFGSPAIWRNVSRYCVENGVKLPSLRRVLMAGAPVAREIHERLLNNVLSEGASTHTPFGATESLPVCDIEGREVLAGAAGQGICVGRPLPGMGVRIMKITEGPVAEWDDAMLAEPGQIGEIVAEGPVVTKEYFEAPEQTGAAKIHDLATGGVLHRMGDVGYIDGKGRLWFCGRKNHMVVTEHGPLYTIPTEAVFNRHPDVFRTALVGLGEAPNQKPVIIAELRKGRPKRSEKEIAEELLRLGADDPRTAVIKDVLFHPEFPTDIRHNAKIFRERLKEWAEARGAAK